MSTPYSVNIEMSVATTDSLSASNFQLYGFKAVRTTMGGGAPLVWFASTTFSTLTSVSWTEDYEAYTSTQSLIPNGTIQASFSPDIDLGQTLNVTDKTGTGTVVAGGEAGAISINNSSGVPFTCGISQNVENVAEPMCAFPLFGTGLDVIAPIEKVLLTFATKPLNTGTVIEQSFAPSYLIDLTGAPGNSRTVSFDINAGWSNQGAIWATQVAPSSNILPLLIDNSPSTVQMLRARFLAKAA